LVEWRDDKAWEILRANSIIGCLLVIVGRGDDNAESSILNILDGIMFNPSNRGMKLSKVYLIAVFSLRCVDDY